MERWIADSTLGASHPLHTRATVGEATGATRIPHGAMVLVDGTSGTVTIL